MGDVHYFDDAKAARYLRETILAFLGDPPDSEYQAGYLAALIDAYREGLGKTGDDRIELAAQLPIVPEMPYD